MKTYMIEREIPGACQLTDDELRGITSTSNDAVGRLERPYTWRTATSPATRSTACTRPRAPRTILEHARRGGFPANLVAEVTAVFDSTGPARAAGLDRRPLRRGLRLAP